MKHSLFAGLIAAAVAGAPTIGHAQIESGDKSVSVSGSIVQTPGSNGGSSSTSGNVFGGLNYFWTRQTAFRLNAGAIISTTNGTSTTFATLGGGLEYDFSSEGQTRVPYLAFDVLSISGGDVSSIQLAPAVGARFFVSRSTAFDVAGVYRQSTDKGATGSYEARFGLSFFFGSDKRK